MIAAGHARPAVTLRLGDPRAKTLPIRYTPPQVAAALLPPRVQTPPTLNFRRPVTP